MYDKWLADRTRWFDASGIRKVFDLAAKLENPVNLSIGQPDFDAPETARQAAIEAISSKKNGYTPTQGAAVLRQLVQKQVDEQFGAGVREAFIASGTSGALFLTIMTLVNPGDEVIIFDPFFVMYDALVRMVGAKPVYISTYPDFHIDVNKVEAAITDKTKLIILNSPCNPTGAIASEEVCRDLAELADRKQVALVSDEIYKFF
ncbi:MAG: aminotransferase class I/II-fold pyridoxal phosphate-dependent enzyme, partial [Thermoguttaceae bacterium]|nr:aminotransferase class I/II-fold pyridoxal phosphate-dependent enzyme [Thermoguttaceae bacterium]